MANKLRVIPLGGLGEFGMHMMALRYGDDIIVIDSGMMFPEDDLLGVDLVTPDLTYLRENRQASRLEPHDARQIERLNQPARREPRRPRSDGS